MYKYTIENTNNAQEAGSTRVAGDIMRAMEVVRAWGTAPEAITAITNGLLTAGDKVISAGGVAVTRERECYGNGGDICKALAALSDGVTERVGLWRSEINHYRGVDSLYAVHTLLRQGKEIMRYSETAGALVINLQGCETDSAVVSVANRAMRLYMPTWHAEVTDYGGLGIWCAGVYYHMFDRRTAFIVLSNGKILVN